MGHLDTFIVGLGYVGMALAEALAGCGMRVVGTTRSDKKARALRLHGIEGHVVSRDGADIAVVLGRLWSEGAALVYTAPPTLDERGHDALLDAALETARERHARAIVYLSTTGLYAERDGGWVDEESPTAPRDDAARARLVAEERCLRAAADLSITGVVFRLAGIYGPGRGLAERLRAGRVMLWGGGQQIVNRIHRDDIVRFVRAALAAPVSASGIYNLADDEPTSLRDVVTHLASELGLPLPAEAPMSQAPSATLTGNKRVRANKAKAAFDLGLLYPSWRNAQPQRAGAR